MYAPKKVGYPIVCPTNHSCIISPSYPHHLVGLWLDIPPLSHHLPHVCWPLMMLMLAVSWGWYRNGTHQSPSFSQNLHGKLTLMAPSAAFHHPHESGWSRYPTPVARCGNTWLAMAMAGWHCKIVLVDPRFPWMIQAFSWECLGEQRMKERTGWSCTTFNHPVVFPFFF